MTIPRTAAVLGLGLIGGSIARGLAAKGVSVLGFDENGESSEAARTCGVLTTVLDSSLRGLESAEWVIIAVPLDSALPLLQLVSGSARRATLITDTGSTKRTIVAEASRLGLGGRFVGSHPMAGSHESGWSASRPDLFEGATTYVCAESISAPDTESARSAEAAQNLWALLGARTERITAHEHDRKVAATSHLPHLLSTTLALTLEDLGISIGELGSGGRDMTRIAGGEEALWKEILLDNADLVAQVTDNYLAKLTRLRTAIAERQTDSVRDSLARGRAWTAVCR